MGKSVSSLEEENGASFVHNEGVGELAHYAHATFVQGSAKKRNRQYWTTPALIWTADAS